MLDLHGSLYRLEEYQLFFGDWRAIQTQAFCLFAGGIGDQDKES
jgi:hypothetical protein